MHSVSSEQKEIIEYLTNVKNGNCVNHLYLDGLNINDSILKEITETIKKTHVLFFVNLDNNKISNSGIEYLLTLNVKNLSILGNKKVSDESILKLALQNKYLSSLKCNLENKIIIKTIKLKCPKLKLITSYITPKSFMKELSLRTKQSVEIYDLKNSIKLKQIDDLICKKYNLDL